MRWGFSVPREIRSTEKLSEKRVATEKCNEGLMSLLFYFLLRCRACAIRLFLSLSISIHPTNCTPFQGRVGESSHAPSANGAYANGNAVVSQPPVALFLSRPAFRSSRKRDQRGGEASCLSFVVRLSIRLVRSRPMRAAHLHSANEQGAGDTHTVPADSGSARVGSISHFPLLSPSALSISFFLCRNPQSAALGIFRVDVPTSTTIASSGDDKGGPLCRCT